MSRLAKLSARFIGEVGFSIGITDVTPAGKLLHGKAEIIKSSYGVCDEYIKQFKSGDLELMPGCDEDQSLEVCSLQACLFCRPGLRLIEHIFAFQPVFVLAACCLRTCTVSARLVVPEPRRRRGCGACLRA